MLRTSDMVLIFMMLMMAAFTYKTKYEGEQQLEKLSKLSAAIDYEENMIKLFSADWAFLTQPERLQVLVETYQLQLSLFPPHPYQDIEFDQLPHKKSDISDFLQEEGSVLPQFFDQGKKKDTFR